MAMNLFAVCRLYFDKTELEFNRGRFDPDSAYSICEMILKSS